MKPAPTTGVDGTAQHHGELQPPTPQWMAGQFALASALVCAWYGGKVLWRRWRSA